MCFIDKYVLVYAYVPEHFLSNKDLSYLDKLVYIRIVGFCRNDEYNNTCFASNGYFAGLFGVKPKAILITIGKLKKLEYINVEYTTDNLKVKRRIITLTSNVWAYLKNNNSSYEEDSVPYMMEYNSNTNYKDNSKSNIFKDIISYDSD